MTPLFGASIRTGASESGAAAKLNTALHDAGARPVTGFVSASLPESMNFTGTVSVDRSPLNPVSLEKMVRNFMVE